LTLTFAGCSYDDGWIYNRFDDIEQRILTLEELCGQMNTNIASLQTLVNALQQNDYITSVTPLYAGQDVIGYTISFTQSPSITIYHGRDGKDGLNGTDGKDGQNGVDGKDGYTPSIAVRQDSDGHYYWTLDGEWLLGNDGQKILAEGLPGRDGQDGQNGADGKDGVDGQDGKDGQNGKDGDYAKEA
ncbi:MAG: DUF4988 domain-containing protein, partial [Muribaculaceae bacterium]|nr:DUF4988 domain-containing protein [Muribaculaceae bacterium]